MVNFVQSGLSQCERLLVIIAFDGTLETALDRLRRQDEEVVRQLLDVPNTGSLPIAVVDELHLYLPFTNDLKIKMGSR